MTTGQSLTIPDERCAFQRRCSSHGIKSLGRRIVRNAQGTSRPHRERGHRVIIPLPMSARAHSRAEAVDRNLAEQWSQIPTLRRNFCRVLFSPVKHVITIAESALTRLGLGGGCAFTNQPLSQPRSAAARDASRFLVGVLASRPTLAWGKVSRHLTRVGRVGPLRRQTLVGG